MDEFEMLLERQLGALHAQIEVLMLIMASRNRKAEEPEKEISLPPVFGRREE
jgi:hypothetical protein